MDKQSTIIYIPHGGGPLPLLDEASNKNMNTYLRSVPQSIKKPDAIIVFSAHWEAPVVSITARSNPGLLFDYYGFPPETYEYRYPAPGQPQLAERAAGLLGEAGIEVRLDAERDLDHGVFIPLMLMYPQADIPCIQISLHNTLDAAFHIQLGSALASLNTENLLVIGSGFSFHNMRVLMKPQTAEDPQNLAFEQWLAQTCSDADLSEAERARRLIDWESAPGARYCHPREEHLLPLQVCYGMAGGPAQLAYQKPTVDYIVSSAYRW